MMKRWRSVFGSAAVCIASAAACFYLAAPSNTAADYGYVMASVCVVANSTTQGSHESNGPIQNWSTTSSDDIDIACPVLAPENDSAGDNFKFSTYVRDNSSGENVSCQAVQYNHLTGANSWSSAVTTSGTPGNTTLTMPVTGTYSRSQNLVALYCRIPNREGGSSPSGMVGYKVEFS